MSNNVFANGRELSCKSGSGKSICAFPDVCFTPPENPATPPGVPIPYPNTGMASDTDGGSKNVKISKKEVMLKNKSSFKKSMGDEAGSAAKKGVITSKNRGKVYFTMWSMDVKIEGENAVRHLDMTTHNHMSMPGNTPPWPFLDDMAFGSDSHACSKMAKNAQEKCQKHTVPHGKGVNRKKTIEAMCADGECKEARKCVLSPETPNNCCDGKTPHHLLPVHCFMPPGHRKRKVDDREPYDGCDHYRHEKAPCICVEGESKEGEHGRLHDVFDDLEDDHLVDGEAGSWSYADARAAAKLTVEQETDCDPECAGTQIDSYHQNGGDKKPNIDDSTMLRADSTGKKTPDGFTPSAPSTVSTGGVF